MVVNATTQFWEDLPPTSATPGQPIIVTGQITNTSTAGETEDYRLSVQIVGVGAAIFPVPLEVWSSPEELSPGELYTAYAMFTMPSYGVGLTVQAEWYNRAGAPAQWIKVGTTGTRNIAVAGVTPIFPTPTPPAPSPIPALSALQLQISPTLILLAVGGIALFLFMTRGKK